MTRILVSGASGIVGYGILRSLRALKAGHVLVGTTIHADSAAPAFCDRFELAPPTTAPGYLDWLLATLRRHHIDLLIPGIEVDVYHWVKHVSEIRCTGAVPLLNTPALIALCKDKWAFYQALKKAGLACAIESSLEPDYDTLVAHFGLPFILKPRRGFGSKGIVRVTSAELFQRHCHDVGPVLMAQPIVGTDDEEFSVSAFCDGRGGRWAAMALRRKLSQEGFTDRAEVVEAAAFVPEIDQLCRLFRPLGPTNFQFRRSADGLKLLEINPRISSATSIRTAFGYNEAAMAIDYFLNDRQPTQPTIRRGRAVRYTDDCIFHEDGVHL